MAMTMTPLVVPLRGGGELRGDLNVPGTATGLVVFAHGSGSSRLSPRNRQVAAALQEGGLGTFLFDLLTVTEEVEDDRTGSYRFNIELLGSRLVLVLDWLRGQESCAGLQFGCFGASTGAAAAVLAAAARPAAVHAVVSRGGRPDLAGRTLAEVRAPTLLIVGGDDHPVLELNRWAAERLGGPAEVAVVPGATHLFEEPGALDRVASLALGWFRRYLATGEPRRGGTRARRSARGQAYGGLRSTRVAPWRRTRRRARGQSSQRPARCVRGT